MQISLNWLKTLIHFSQTPEEVAQILTATGLEVEHFETNYSVKGGLKDLRIAEVIEKWKHPDADKLNVTRVNLGDKIVQIVCGASNVESGQRVVVAPVGSFVHPTKGEAFQIQKAKIRGEVSEGMICAEDEIGLGTGHEGIMVLPKDAPIGMLASEYFSIQEDVIFEIGLTPNRADAASHWGVARDLIAYFTFNGIPYSVLANLSPKVSYGTNAFQVQMLASEACPRFSGVVIKNITVQESPDWLKQALLSIGLTPINAIVDITNYIQHTVGQPMHAYDLKVVGNQMVVSVFDQSVEFEFLDGKKTKETKGDLFICNANTEPMCLAGIFGGKSSGVDKQTTTIFLESAYFNPVQIRKSSKKHGLKTDASFRFERGVDIQNTVNALNMAIELIQKLCPSAEVDSPLIDIKSSTAEPKKVLLKLESLKKVAGFEIDPIKLALILKGLGIDVLSKSAEEYQLSIPTYRVDVSREIDVIEEVLRIYGFDNIPFSSHIQLNLNGKKLHNADVAVKKLSQYLVSQGFYEILNNSLTSAFNTEVPKPVALLNPLSNELNQMRTTLLNGHLESIAFNQNRKHSNIRFFEFGSVYSVESGKYIEEERCMITLSGNLNEKLWNHSSIVSDYFHLKGWVMGVCGLLGIRTKESTIEHPYYTDTLAIYSGKVEIGCIGIVKSSLRKAYDIGAEIYVAELYWNNISKIITQGTDMKVVDISKFPMVHRDLALLVDDHIQSGELLKLANSLSSPLIKGVKVFDVYRGDKLAQGKKSYALNFAIQDESKTLTDIEIDDLMKKLIEKYESSGFQLRN